MKLEHFVGCKDFNDVNDKFLQICEKAYPGGSALRRTPRFTDIVREYQYIEETDITFPISTFQGTYFTNSQGKQVYREDKRKYTRKDVITPDVFINNTYKEITKQKGNVSALYFKYLAFTKDSEQSPCKQDLELIAKLCNYNQGWVFYKKKELNIK